MGSLRSDKSFSVKDGGSGGAGVLEPAANVEQTGSQFYILCELAWSKITGIVVSPTRSDQVVVEDDTDDGATAGLPGDSKISFSVNDGGGGVLEPAAKPEPNLAETDDGVTAGLPGDSEIAFSVNDGGVWEPAAKSEANLAETDTGNGADDGVTAGLPGDSEIAFSVNEGGAEVLKPAANLAETVDFQSQDRIGEGPFSGGGGGGLSKDGVTVPLPVQGGARLSEDSTLHLNQTDIEAVHHAEIEPVDHANIEPVDDAEIGPVHSPEIEPVFPDIVPIAVPIVVPVHPETVPLQVLLDIFNDREVWAHLNPALGIRRSFRSSEWELRGTRYKSFIRLIGSYVVDGAITLKEFDAVLRATGFYPPEETFAAGEEKDLVVVDNAMKVMNYNGRGRIIAIGDLKTTKIIMITTAACLLRYCVVGVEENQINWYAKKKRFDSLGRLMCDYVDDISCPEDEFVSRLESTGFHSKVNMKKPHPKLPYTSAKDLLSDCMGKYRQDASTGVYRRVKVNSPILVSSTNLKENKKLILAAVACNVAYQLLPPNLRLYT